MAQAGYTPILIYASGTATNIPTAGNLISGSSGAELAINYADGKLYYKDGSGNVKLLSIGYGSSSVTPTNGGVQYGTGTALALTAAGSSGQILRSNGAAAPTWADLSTLGVNTISFGTTGLTPNSATAGAVTVAGTLVTANGGTGLGGATPFTANGVLYASSASALTSGSALTFDGTNFAASNQIIAGIGVATANVLARSNVSNGGSGFSQFLFGNASTDTRGFLSYSHASEAILFGTSSAEQMRLTSTGLGIGTSSPTAAKLHVAGYNGGSVYPIRMTSTNSGVEWAFETGGTNAATSFFAIRDIGNSSTPLTINSSGNLGIGTSSPASKLTVSRGGSAGIVSNFTDGLAQGLALTTGTGYFGFYNPNYGAITFRDGGNTIENMRLTDSGNLGLGVTPSAWGAGQRAFQIGNSSALSDNGGTYFNFNNNCYFNGTNWIYKNTAAASQFQSDGNNFYWQIAPSGTAGNAITFTQAMTLDASGNLSVGTTTIATQITFAGDSGITYQRSTDNAFAGVLDYLKSRGSAASPTAVQNGDDLFTLRVAPYHGSAYTYLTNTSVQVDGTFTSGQNPPTRITWYTNAANGGATERARITSGGDLLVGTTSSVSGYRIRVQNVNDATGFIATNASGGYCSLGLDSAATSDGRITWTNALIFGASGSERARITSGGALLVGTTNDNPVTSNAAGIALSGAGIKGLIIATVDGGDIIAINRKTNDGNLVTFHQDGTLEGTISVSGNTVSYNAFAGSHWSQLQDGSKPDILRGTVMESINELCVWPGEQNERLPKSKISDTAGSKKVYGVFMTWDNDWTATNDMYITAVGAFICRVNGGVTVQEGDLLESNGDGTARVQADDIIRSSTIGKVTSTVKTHEYDDGSYCVPTVLYCG